MNRIAIGWILVAFAVAAGGCTSRDSASRAPSSFAYRGGGEGSANEQAGMHRDGMRGDSVDRDGVGRDVRGYGPTGGSRPAREVIVQAERERFAKPLVPAFPVGMRQKVLQDIGTVFFGFDNSGLSEATKRQLDKNIAWMKVNPRVMVRLIGHADERGTSEYNLALGMRRSDRVREYVINRGISSERLITVSYGEELPLRRGHNEAAWTKNRRVEFGLGEATAQR